MSERLTPWLDQIHCGEASAMLTQLPDDCIDLTVTSPPYGKLRKYHGFTFDFEAIARQLYRVTKPGGVVVWVVADETKDGSESGTSFRQALGFMDIGFKLHDTMIYGVDGVGAKGSCLAYWQAFEFMFVLSKGKPATVNRLADRRNKKAGSNASTSPKADRVGSRRKNGGYTINEYGVRTNIWYYLPGHNGDDQTDHEAPFPEDLARDHILSWSNPGAVILDPMMGSGTVAKMSRQLNRHFIGFDISQDYVDQARRRVAGVQLSFVEVMG